MSAVDFARAVRQLEELAAYPDGWDGSNSYGVDGRTLSWCRQVLTLVDGGHVPELTLNENGTITFEWEGAGHYTYLEVGATRYALLVKRGAASEMVNGDNWELAGIVRALVIPNPAGLEGAVKKPQDSGMVKL